MCFLGPDISDVLSPVKGFQVVNQVVQKLKIGKEGREGETHSGWDFEPCCIKIKTGSVLAGEVPACPSSEAGVLGAHSLTWPHAGSPVRGVPSLGHGPGWNVTSCGMQEALKGHVQLTGHTGDEFGRLSCFLSQIALRSPFSSPFLQSVTPTFPSPAPLLPFLLSVSVAGTWPANAWEK